MNLRHFNSKSLVACHFFFSLVSSRLINHCFLFRKYKIWKCLWLLFRAIGWLIYLLNISRRCYKICRINCGYRNRILKLVSAKVKPSKNSFYAKGVSDKSKCNCLDTSPASLNRVVTYLRLFLERACHQPLSKSVNSSSVVGLHAQKSRNSTLSLVYVRALNHPTKTIKVFSCIMRHCFHFYHDVYEKKKKIYNHLNCVVLLAIPLLYFF